MKKILLTGIALVSSLGFAQSRLTVADYVLAMPNELRLVAETTRLKTWIGDTKKSEEKSSGCAVVNKDLKNDYMEIAYGGCEAGSGDMDYFSFAVWRNSSSQNVVIGALNYVSDSRFGNRLVLSKTTNGKQFVDVTSKILPMLALQNLFKQCKADINNIGYKIPKSGTSLSITELNGTLAYTVDWNNKTQVFVLGKGKC
jgi:hypothetical protein